MQVTAVLFRWYRSFNIAALGPADPVPSQTWHFFRGELFPFVRVPLDKLITTIVGANESGKSHLLSALVKVIGDKEPPGPSPDRYEIKDICRYCGFGGLDEGVWPEIGIEISVNSEELKLFEAAVPANADGSLSGERTHLTVILNGANPDSYATVYSESVASRTFSEAAWKELARTKLPDVSILDSKLALPNEVHVDELIDLYKKSQPQPVVDPLAVQTLWREISPIQIVAGQPIDAGTAQRVDQIKTAIQQSTRASLRHEGELVLQLFADVLNIQVADLERIRKYSNAERGYVEWLNDEINNRIERELDISRYWDQDEDFRLSVNYKLGTFHFQIKDRTGSTYTFNERSSGLRYFLSYYIQAKALEKKNQARGVVILMDEPDSFLSASGQRSLLRVFDALVSNKTAHAPCQLVYTTHSPFLINRNFPGRIRLVRKGDGTEGTQYVKRAAVRRFEPVRSALSIDAADTLFLGSTNVVLEGHSDQKLLIACVQRFGEPGKLDQMLDLNAVTLVSADGAPHAPELVRKAMRGDEKPPLVVVLLDGDEAGQTYVAEVAKLIDEKQVCTLSEVEVPQKVFVVLEDLIPPGLAGKAIALYVAGLGLTLATTYDGSTVGATHAKKITAFCKATVPELASYEDVEIRAGVVDALVDLLADEEFNAPELDELFENVKAVCHRINTMIEHAERNANRHSLKKLLRQHIETFDKRFKSAGSKGDVRKLLLDMQHVATGRGEDFERARKNIELLGDQLDNEAKQNSEQIDIADWRARFSRLKNEPWAKAASWQSIKANRSTIAGQTPSLSIGPEQK